MVRWSKGGAAWWCDRPVIVKDAPHLTAYGYAVLVEDAFTEQRRTVLASFLSPRNHAEYERTPAHAVE